MSVRAFSVFQDAPPDPRDAADGPALALALAATDAAATLLSTLAAVEKENLHPVTGQRAGPTVAPETKKRKTRALATKVLVVPASKKHKELDAEPKKARKPLGSAQKSRASDAKKSSSKSRSVRKPSPLPPVAEEHDAQRQPPRLSMSQINIDARCYELTVSPLADVSAAYDAPRLASHEPDLRAQREKSPIHDYFSPPSVDKPLPPARDTPCNVDEPPHRANGSSTPERTPIYSAFTFSSPSPTSERFKQAQSSPTCRTCPASDAE